MARFRQKFVSPKGQSLVEMALVLPILLLLFMGIMDFGRMLFLYAQLANAAREGARYGAVVGVYDEDAGELPQFQDCAAIRQTINSRFGLELTIPDEDINIIYDDGVTPLGFNCNGVSGPSVEQVVIGTRIVVEVESEFSFITPLVSSFVPSIPVSFTAARTIIVGGTEVPPCCY